MHPLFGVVAFIATHVMPLNARLGELPVLIDALDQEGAIPADRTSLGVVRTALGFQRGEPLFKSRHANRQRSQFFPNRYLIEDFENV